MTPEQLDSWRWEQAVAAHPHAGQHGIAPCIVDTYRELVREDVQPPAEPDQDTLDTRAVLAAWADFEEMREDRLAGKSDDWPEFQRTKTALSQIKDRVRKEAIMALPDGSTIALEQASGFMSPALMTRALGAIKQVFGQQT